MIDLEKIKIKNIDTGIVANSLVKTHYSIRLKKKSIRPGILRDLKAHDPYIIVEAITSKLLNSILSACLQRHETTNFYVLLTFNPI